MAATDQDIGAQVCEIVANVLAVEEDEVRPERKIDDVAAIDSLSFAEIASELDATFEIRVPTSGLYEGMTVAAIISLVEGLVRGDTSSAQTA